MTQNKWAEELVGFMQSSFETTMSTVSTLQNQGEKILNTVLDQGVVAQQEGRKVLTEWAGMAKKGSEDYKKLMAENMHKVSDFFKVTQGGGGKAK
jgi:polyhydroxyalkanoate synthesis regulator phasin